MKNYFTVLGVEKKFAQDLSRLEKNYYLLSRALHPDRFTGASAAAKEHSLARMSFLNDAYRTLKDSEERRAYYLNLEKIASPSSSAQASKPPMPPELAESWFDLQDALMEANGGGEARAQAFELGSRHFKRSSIRRNSPSKRRSISSSSRSTRLPWSKTPGKIWKNLLKYLQIHELAAFCGERRRSHEEMTVCKRARLSEDSILGIPLGSGDHPADNDPIIGIDLGTTNSLVAKMEHGVPVILKTREGKTSASLHCFFDSEQGKPVIGYEAKNYKVREDAPAHRFFGKKTY